MEKQLHIIQVEKANTHGTARFYPVNDQAKKACKLIDNQKTLTPENIKGLKAMGFVIKQVVVAGEKIVEVCDL